MGAMVSYSFMEKAIAINFSLLSFNSYPAASKLVLTILAPYTKSIDCMYLKNFSKWAVIFGTLLIWSVKFIVRPYVPVAHFMQPLIDVLPNLIGSFLLPFGACWFFKKYFKLQSIQDLRITCLFGLLLVIINEYIQLIPLFGRTFDYLDILSSFAGVYVGHNVFAKLLLKQNLQNPHQLV